MAGRIFPSSHRWRRFPVEHHPRRFPQAYRPPSTAGVRDILVDIHLPSGVRRISFSGVSAVTGQYSAELLAVSPIQREVNFLSPDLRSADCQIEIAASSWISAVADQALYNRRVVIRAGVLSDPWGALSELFVGRIREWSLANNRLSLSVRDTTWDRFSNPLSASLALLDPAVFVDMPLGAEYAGLLVPVILGQPGTPGVSGELPCPAYLIDPAVSQAKYRYVLAQGSLDTTAGASTTYIRRFGGSWVGASPTFGTATYGGVQYAIADFASDQRDSADRSGALEITHRFPGLWANPVQGLHEFLRAWLPGVADNEFDFSGNATGSPLSASAYLSARAGNNGSIDEAVKTADDDSAISGYCVCGDPARTFRDVVSDFTRSFPMGLYSTRGGQYGIYYLRHGGTRDFSIGQNNPPAGSPTPTGYYTLSEDTDILANSYRARGVDVEQAAFSEVSLSSSYSWTGSNYMVPGLSASSSTASAHIGTREVRIEAPALVSAASYATWLDLGSPFNVTHEFELPVSWLDRLELGRLVLIKHRHAPTSLTREILIDSPWGFWRLSEQKPPSSWSAVATDISGNARHGTYSGSGLLTGQASGFIGEPTTAAYFDGSTARVALPSFSLGTTFGLFARLRTRSTAQMPVWSNRRSGPASGLYLGTGGLTVNPLLIYNDGGSPAGVYGTAQLNDGKWHTIEVWCNSGTTTAYVDGILDISTSQTISTTGANSSYIGHDAENNEWFTGWLADVAVFTAAPGGYHVGQIRSDLTRGRNSGVVPARITYIDMDPSPSARTIRVRALQIRTTP